MAPNLEFTLPRCEPRMPRNTSLSDDVEDEWTKLYLPADMSWFPRRPSLSQANPTPGSGSRVKRRDTSLDYVDDFGSKSTESSPSATCASAHSVPLHLPPPPPSRHRTSILSAASGALGLRKKIGSVSRKKPHFSSLPHSGAVMPDVIEISARNNTTVTSTIGGATAHRDYEYEERERLRDAAAQSIGLLHGGYKSESRLSLDSLQSSPLPAPFPPFPATLAALCPFTELLATLPKFTPPSSLLIYALAKQWKPRTIVLTLHSPTHKAHVHLFKGSSKDDKEVERLEVTDDSVIFVAEEDVGGRGNVVKFAGKDVSARHCATTGEETSHTMWFLQITDPTESQRWITAIKGAVLTQRAARAGFDIPTQTNGRNQPMGDMDVMLSMHQQGILAMHPTRRSPPSPPMPASPSPPASLRSLRMNTLSSSTPTTTMKGIFSGTRPRSPSIEGSATLACSSGHPEDSFSAAGNSLLTMLRTKSSADSSSSPSQSLCHSLSLPLPHIPGEGSPAPSLRSAYAPVIISASDLKISKDRDAANLSATIPSIGPSGTAPGSSTPPTLSLAPQGTLTLSLQPPPRKSKYVAASTPATVVYERQAMYKQAGGNRSVAGNFGIPSKGSGDVTPGETSPVAPDSPTFSDAQSGSFLPNLGFDASFSSVDDIEKNDEVAPTLMVNGTVHSLSSGGGSAPVDKLLQSAAIAKRWTRQGLPLPKQLMPPSGPPPAIPPLSENNHRTSMESNTSVPIAYTADRSPSSSSSDFCSRPQTSPRSGSSLSPTFRKRASGSSTFSASSTNTSDSRGRSLIPLFSTAESFPSSLRSVASNRRSSRPMSFSIPAFTPGAHIVTNKRRSMPPPRPAPTFAPPPAPMIQEFTRPGSAPMPQKTFRSSVAQRALRLSLTSPKPPPSSALPPRPDEPVIRRGHRRSSSAGTPERPASTHSGASSLNSPSRSLSIRQRLRILSTPSTSHSPVQSLPSSVPSLQVSTLDLSDDNDDDLPTPCLHAPQPFGLGEPIMTIQNDPSFLQLSTPVSPTTPKSLPRCPFQSMPPLSSGVTIQSDLCTPPLGPDREFVALSPPPPRRGSKPHVVTAVQTEKNEAEEPGTAPREGNTLMTLSEHGSVVSLGFVST